MKEAEMADEDQSEMDTTNDDASSEDKPDLAAELAKWKSMARKNEALAKQNATAAAKLAKIEEASKSELERAQAAAAEADQRAKAAEERIARALTKAAVSAAAAKAGAIDADAVLALLPPDAVTVEGDNVTGVDAAIEALRKSKPYLFGKPKPAAGSADGGRQSDKPAQWTREDLKGKSSAEIEAARKAGLLVSIMSGSNA
jgi:hypothetical protein